MHPTFHYNITKSYVSKNIQNLEIIIDIQDLKESCKFYSINHKINWQLAFDYLKTILIMSTTLTEKG